MGKRADGEGSVFQRKSDGLWVAQAPSEYIGGKRVRKQEVHPTQRAASLALAEMKRARERGKDISKPDPTVKQFLERWLEVKREEVKRGELAASTVDRHYAIHVPRHLVPTLGRKRLGKLTVTDVQKLMSEKSAAGLSPRTVTAIRGTLRAALNDAMRWGEVTRNVAALAKPPKQKKHKVKPFTVADAEKLLAAMRGDRFENLYRLTLSMGLRRSEVLGLRWSDVDLVAGTIYIRQGVQRVKGGGLQVLDLKTEASEAPIAIPAQLLPVLKDQRRWWRSAKLKAANFWQGGDLVFPNDVGRALGPEYVSHQFRKLADAAGFPELTFHGLRHGAATLLLAQGVPLAVVQETLRHSTYYVTKDFYAHVAPELQRTAADAMDAVFLVADVVADVEQKKRRSTQETPGK